MIKAKSAARTNKAAKAKTESLKVSTNVKAGKLALNRCEIRH